MRTANGRNSSNNRFEFFSVFSSDSEVEYHYYIELFTKSAMCSKTNCCRFQSKRSNTITIWSKEGLKRKD